jgi:hypothetical protein
MLSGSFKESGGEDTGRLDLDDNSSFALEFVL